MPPLPFSALTFATPLISYEARLRDITKDFEAQQQAVQRQRLLQPASSSASSSAAAKPLPTSQDHLKLAKQAQADSMASLARSAKLVEDTTVDAALRPHSCSSSNAVAAGVGHGDCSQASLANRADEEHILDGERA